jgi:hypothetical protein
VGTLYGQVGVGLLFGWGCSWFKNDVQEAKSGCRVVLLSKLYHQKLQPDTWRNVKEFPLLT